MEEIWKPINGFEGCYEVSTLGRIRSLDRESIDSLGRSNFYYGKLLTPQVVKDGYLQVGLSKNQKVIRRYVHQFVADTFLENPNCYSEINHIDHNPLNNAIDNLEWVSHKDNIRDMVEYNIKIGNFNDKEEYNGKMVSKCYLDVCPICGGVKYKVGNICLKCYNTNRSKNIPTRDELMHSLLIRNFSKISTIYNVSGNAIRKWCKKYSLPTKTSELKAMTDDEILSL